MRVKAVLFDLGGTLIKTADIPEIFKSILQTYGVNVPIEEIRKAHRGVEESLVHAQVVEGMLEGGQDFWIGWNLRARKPLTKEILPKSNGYILLNSNYYLVIRG